MFAITGGGTGGHLAIAKALAQELQKRQIPCIYIGSHAGQDKMWFAQSDLFNAVYFLDSTGVVNKKGLAKLAALHKIYNATKMCKKLFARHNTQAVISVGGFSAAGASLATLGSKVKLFIHEQNAISGSLNKLLSPFATQIFGSFAFANTRFYRCDYPVRQEFFAHARTRTEIKTILFLGGSQGAKAINNIALDLAPTLLARGYHIIHQCGEKDKDRVSQAYAQQGILQDIELFAFSPKLIDFVEKSDVCISRAGAGSVWESCANGLPCFFIPYPFAAKDHQYHNALEFATANLAQVCRESTLHPQQILAFLDSLTPRIAQVSQALQDKISPDGAHTIISQILARLQNATTTNLGAIK